jgi:hypothetical protein
MAWIVALCTIKDNVDGHFAVSDKFNPETGEYKLVAVSRTTKAGGWVDLPSDEAARLIKLGAAREPTAEELQLHRLSRA